MREESALKKVSWWTQGNMHGKRSQSGTNHPMNSLHDAQEPAVWKIKQGPGLNIAAGKQATQTKRRIRSWWNAR